MEMLSIGQTLLHASCEISIASVRAYVVLFETLQFPMRRDILLMRSWYGILKIQVCHTSHLGFSE